MAMQKGKAVDLRAGPAIVESKISMRYYLQLFDIVIPEGLRGDRGKK